MVDCFAKCLAGPSAIFDFLKQEDDEDEVEVQGANGKLRRGLRVQVFHGKRDGGDDLWYIGTVKSTSAIFVHVMQDNQTAGEGCKGREGRG